MYLCIITYQLNVCSNEEIFINFSISLSYKICAGHSDTFFYNVRNLKKNMSMRVSIQIEHPLCKVACMHRLYLIVL